MTKYFCDWCGKEKERGELKAVAFTVEGCPEPMFRLQDCCEDCQVWIAEFLQEELEDQKAGRDETGLSA